MKKNMIITGCIFAMLAVIAGAFGAHGLQGYLSPKSIEVWETGVQYQFYHAFAILFLSTLARHKTRLLIHAYRLFTIGIILFSGSLYILACSQVLEWTWLPALGPITPIGGALFIAGWVVTILASYKIKFS